MVLYIWRSVIDAVVGVGGVVWVGCSGVGVCFCCARRMSCCPNVVQAHPWHCVFNAFSDLVVDRYQDGRAIMYHTKEAAAHTAAGQLVFPANKTTVSSCSCCAHCLACATLRGHAAEVLHVHRWVYSWSFGMLSAGSILCCCLNEG